MEAVPEVATLQEPDPLTAKALPLVRGAGRRATYLPEMLRVSHGAGLHLLWGQEYALEGPNPGALLDPLRRANAVGQAGHGARAQAHLPRQVSQPLRQLRRGRGGRGATSAHQPAQRVQRPVHWALSVAVVRTHIATCRRHAGGRGGRG